MKTEVTWRLVRGLIMETVNCKTGLERRRMGHRFLLCDSSIQTSHIVADHASISINALPSFFRCIICGTEIGGSILSRGSL